MMHEKYGSVVTAGEMLMLDVLEAQRRTNELLEKMFMLQQTSVKTAETGKAKGTKKATETEETSPQ